MSPQRVGKRNGRRGFTLLELLVSVAVGTLVTLGAFLVYKDAMRATTLVAQRSTVQDNTRASINAIAQELNMAGFGLPIGGVVVPNGALYGCTGAGCLSSTFSFPTVVDSGVTKHVMFGVIPHYQQGGAPSGTATDAITMAYVDKAANAYLDTCVTCGYDVPGAVSAITFSGGTTNVTFNTVTPPLNDKTYGFQAGDLAMITNQNGTAVVEVTSATATTLTMSSGDTMGLNTSSGLGSVANLQTCTTTCRFPTDSAGLPTVRVNKLVLVTYYVQTNALTYLPPRLMRQVNARAPVPVGEQMEDLDITYDIYDPENSAPVQSALTNPPVLSVIKKVNLRVMAKSDLKSMAGMSGGGAGSQQRITLTTSVSPRNLSFFNEYE